MSELSIGVSAYLTLETISEISNLTRGARGCVVGGCEEGGLLLGGSELGDKNGVVRSGKGCLGEGQVVLMGGEGRSREEVGESEIGGMRDGRGRDEVEDVSCPFYFCLLGLFFWYIGERRWGFGLLLLLVGSNVGFALGRWWESGRGMLFIMCRSWGWMAYTRRFEIDMDSQLGGVQVNNLI